MAPGGYPQLYTFVQQYYFTNKITFSPHSIQHFLCIFNSILSLIQKREILLVSSTSKISLFYISALYLRHKFFDYIFQILILGLIELLLLYDLRKLRVDRHFPQHRSSQIRRNFIYMTLPKH